MNKKEYWLNTNCNSYTENESSAPRIGAVHVVEFSLYTDALKKIKNLKQKIVRMKVEQATNLSRNVVSQTQE